MRLINGSRVVIVGGGPAGSFTALHLLSLSAQAHLDLDITIFEARDFSRPGPGNCNKCAGILSSPLVQNMEQLGLILPSDVIQSTIDTYILHVDRAQFPLPARDSSRRIISVYRGGGPRLGSAPLPSSFDAWLLRQARERGARIVSQRIQAIRPAARPVVSTAKEEIEADLVVVASGVNSRSVLDPAWGYQPPQVEVMAQDEILGLEGLADRGVHVFFDNPPGLIFGALIPKGRYTNLSLLGHGLPPDAVRQFLFANGLAGRIRPDSSLLCGCSPRIATAPATGYFADRMVAVGDAAVTRLYKDGIGSAFLTAAAAAQTAVMRGVSRQDFLAGYHPACRRISADNAYGRPLLRLWAWMYHDPRLRRVWLLAIRDEVSRPDARAIHTQVLWGIFTGDESYCRLFWKALSAPALAGLFLAAMKRE